MIWYKLVALVIAFLYQLFHNFLKSGEVLRILILSKNGIF